MSYILIFVATLRDNISNGVIRKKKTIVTFVAFKSMHNWRCYPSSN